MRWRKMIDKAAGAPAAPADAEPTSLDRAGLPSGLARRLADWQGAGLVDAQTAGRIAAFEAARHRPRLPMALATLGGFAVALGLIAIIAANWDAIPIALRLGLHVALNLGLGLFIWMAARSLGDAAGGDGAVGAAGRLRVEAGLLLLSLSTLALVAHIGQSFQLQGDLTGLTGTWLLLATPFTWLLVRAPLHRFLWLLGLILWVGSVLADHWLDLHEWRLSGTAVMLCFALLYAARALPSPLDPGWTRFLGRSAAGLLVAATSFVLLVLRPLLDENPPPEAITDAGIAAAIGFLAIGAAHLLVPADRTGLRRGVGLLLALSPGLAVLPFMMEGTPAAIITGILFCLYWIAIARLALLAHRPDLFKLAVALIALRVFVVYLEATGGLLATGFGLIAGGVILFALALGARRVMAWGSHLEADARPGAPS